MKEKKANLRSTTRRRKTTAGNLPLSQEKYENVLVDSIIDGMLPMSIVSLEAFKRYTHGKCFFIYTCRINLRKKSYDLTDQLGGVSCISFMVHGFRSCSRFHKSVK